MTHQTGDAIKPREKITKCCQGIVYLCRNQFIFRSSLVSIEHYCGNENVVNSEKMKFI